MIIFLQNVSFVSTIIFFFLIISNIISNRHLVLSIVTKYRLDSVAIVNVYHPINWGSSNEYFSGNHEELYKHFETNSQEATGTIRTLTGKKGLFRKALNLRISPGSAVSFLRLLHKRILKWHSYNSLPDENYSLWNKTTQSGLDIDLHLTGNEYRNIKARIYTVYPGTMWCGIGNMADDDRSIGFFHITDNCCRQHDKCFDSIPGKSSRHGLTNSGQFTRSHCECDRKFYYCLKRANSFVAHKIGVAYFNILRPQCFRKEHPIIDCISWYDERCTMYVVHERKKLIWQWFDNKHF